MKNFQPLFLENLRISIPGHSILRFAHHRHTARSDQVQDHHHKHSQFLLYLRGHGVQILGSESIPVRRGSFLYLPARTIHGFRKSMKASPLSLIMDFKEKRPLASRPMIRILSTQSLTEIESALNLMMRTADFGPSGSISGASKILHLFSLLHMELSNERSGQRKVHPQTEAARRTIENCPSMVSSPGRIALLMNEDLSSLNRKIRSESGLNLSTLLDEKRQRKAYELLLQKDRPIAEVAWRCGFQDPNYFSRWFRRKVGQTPSQWRSGAT